MSEEYFCFEEISDGSKFYKGRKCQSSVIIELHRYLMNTLVRVMTRCST